MKISLIKRWKRKQIKLRRKYSRNVNKRFKRKRDFSGKFFVLLSNTKRAAILKFINQKMCKALYAILISRRAVKQISPKYIVSKRRNRKLLRQVEVIVTEKFKNKFKPNVRKKVEKPKQVAPIKIFSCTVCNHKFTNQQQFRQHQHATQDPDSSASEAELIIDDDVMLVPDDPCTSRASKITHSRVELNLKSDPDDLIPDRFYCMMDDCGKSFDKEYALIVHIGMQHNNDIKRFPCQKCGEKFSRESALLAHKRLRHPAEIIAPLPISNTRRKPLQNKKPSPTTIRKAVNKSLEAAKLDTIIFRRYDSEKSNFICRICSVNFEQRSHLDRHMSGLHIMKVYNCYKCHVPYAKGMQLLNHLKAAHLNQVNEPGYIGTISDLESVSFYRCAFCQYSSKERFRVDEHSVNEHYDEYERSECIEEDHASSPDSLEELLLPETEKILRKNDDLLLEMAAKKTMPAYDNKKRKPSNDPSFKFRCVRCGRRFARKRALRNHACERITGISENGSTPAASSLPVLPVKRNNNQIINGFFQCALCPQVFTDKEMYNNHLTISHPAHQSKVTNGFYGSSI